ncbi:MAG: alanine:cation symporter family protein [Myxococcota bacterium]
MERLLDGLWNPILGGFVLCAGLLVMLGTGLLPLRRLGLAPKRWRAGSPSAAAVLLAASASVTTISAAIAAVSIGGRGALVWMWIASVLGMGLHFAEAKLTRQSGTDGVASPAFAYPVIAVAVVAGGLWQGSQVAALGSASLSLPAAASVGVVIGLALLCMRVRSLTTLGVVAMPVLGLGLFTVVAALAAFDDPFKLQLALGDAVNEAFGLQSAATGTVGGALASLIAAGMLRAVTAANLGVGAAGASTALDPEATPEQAGASAMLVPLLVVGLVSTTAGLALLTSPGDAPLADGKLYPLERHESRGLRPSKKVGQTVVLPENTPYEKGQHYAMRLRADPRGHKMAKLLSKENAVILPAWTISEAADTVSFRAREPEKAKHAAWDVHIPCTRELFGGKEGSPQFVRLTPKDESVVFTELIQFYELDPAPYVNVGDFHWVGAVAMANSPDEALGEHLAMFQWRDDDTPFDPKLHEFFRNGYRGPYPDTDEPAPPWTFIAAEDFDAPLDSRVALEVSPDPRGVDALRLNRVGKAEGPPWNAMLEVHEFVLRHPTDATQDIRVPVAARLDGFRVRFDVLDPAWQDFRKLATMEGFTGPYAVMDDVTFEAEVHGDTRLPLEAKDRRSLVPLDTDPRPMGPGTRGLVDPHPAELIAVGYGPPHRPQGDLAALARVLEAKQPGFGGMAFGIAALLMAAGSVLGWALLVAAPARRALGDGGATALPLVVCLAPALGLVLAQDLVESLAILAASVAVLPVIATIVLKFAELRRSDAP